MAKTNNFKTATAGEVRNILAGYVVARDVLAVELDELQGKLRNVSACLKTDLEDLAKLNAGETVGRDRIKVEESIKVTKENRDALKVQVDKSREKFDSAIAPALALMEKCGTVNIDKRGKWCTSETRGATPVSKIFAGYFESVNTGDTMPYRKAVTDWLIACGVTPCESGVSFLMTVGGTRENRGKAYLKSRVKGEFAMDKAAYSVTDAGREKFYRDFLNRVCKQAGDALPVRKVEYELTGKKTKTTK